MNIKKLKNIIAGGENLTTEFKQRFSTHTKIAKEIIAFANTIGGILLFGIDDDGSIYPRIR
jgi:predicted HTH transcriptional regulator